MVERWICGFQTLRMAVKPLQGFSPYSALRPGEAVPPVEAGKPVSSAPVSGFCSVP